MSNVPDTKSTDGVPTYLGRGDPAGRFADYYPAWVDKMADDITLEGSLLDGVVQGADAVRAVIGGVRQLYDRQDFNFAGPWGDNSLLAGLIPQARAKIYPDAAHGFLFQHHAEFASDVDAFLRE